MSEEINILEASNNLAKDNLVVYYKYRYTFDKEETDITSQKLKAQRLCQVIRDNFLADPRLTMGIEHYTKGMVTTKPHVHIHFLSRHKSDTIRKHLARYFDMIGRVQSCKAEVLVSEDKFFRYPLKQQKGDTFKYFKCFGFESEKQTEMVNVAYECWKQAAEIAVGKLEKKIERSSKDRLFDYLDSLHFDSVSEKQICIAAYQYYVENEPNFSYSVVDGYVHMWMLQNKYVSYSEFYDKKH